MSIWFLVIAFVSARIIPLLTSLNVCYIYIYMKNQILIHCEWMDKWTSAVSHLLGFKMITIRETRPNDYDAAHENGGWALILQSFFFYKTPFCQYKLTYGTVSDCMLVIKWKCVLGVMCGWNQASVLCACWCYCFVSETQSARDNEEHICELDNGLRDAEGR